MSSDTSPFIPTILIITGSDGQDEYRPKVIQDIDSLFTKGGIAIAQRMHACFADIFPVNTRQEADRVLVGDLERVAASDGVTVYPMRIIDLRDSGDFTFPNVTHP